MTRPEAPPAGLAPDLPRDAGGQAVFAEPWQAHAFALAVKLQAAGHFTWSEWSKTLGAEIKAAQARGDPDDGTTYYAHWLAALRRLITEKRLLAAPEIETRKAAWAEAYERTPHGKPVVLGKGESG